MVAATKRSFAMKSALMAGAAMVLLSAGSAFAAGGNSATTGAAPTVTSGTGGYVYPDYGSSADVWAVPAVPPAQAAGRFHRSRIYLYPPNEGGNEDSSG
jgi:hypothetical protein